MKKLIFFLICSLFATTCFAAISIGKVGGKMQSAAEESVISSTWTTGGASTAGNTIIAVIYNYNSSARTFAVTDDAGNVYTSSYTWNLVWESAPDYAPLGQCVVFWSTNTVAVTTVTVTASGWEIWNMAIVEVEGLAADPLDKATTSHDNGYWGGSTWTGNATGVLSQANELIFVPVYDFYHSTVTYSSVGYTQSYCMNGQAVFTKIVSATDSVTPSGTNNILIDPIDWRIWVMGLTFKGADAGGESAPSTNAPVIIIQGYAK